MPHTLTVQTFLEGAWQDALLLTFANPAKATDAPVDAEVRSPGDGGAGRAHRYGIDLFDLQQHPTRLAHAP